VAVAAACVQFKPLSCTMTLNIDGMWGQNIAGLMEIRLLTM